MKMKAIGRKWAAAAMALAAGVMTAGAVEPVLDNLPGAPGQSRSYWEAVRAEAAAKKAADKAAVETAQAEGEFFTGKPYDADLGGYVFKYRTYDPHLGRWTTPDPSGFPDGANGYAYCVEGIAGVDPLGLTGKSLVWVYCSSVWVPADTNMAIDVAMNKGFNSAYIQMEKRDAETSGSDNPLHYLDDGDVFMGCVSASSFDQILGLLDTYDKICLGAHGITDDEGNYSNIYHIGSEIHDGALIEERLGDHLLMFRGCGYVRENGSNAGELTISEVISAFTFKSSDYLKE